MCRERRGWRALFCTTKIFMVSRPPLSDIFCQRQQTYHELFLYLLVPVFTLFYWRGTWILLDHYLFPSSAMLSGWTSLTIGYGGLGLFFITQYYGITGHLYHELFPSHDHQRTFQFLLLLLSRIESYIIGFFVVNSWRGIWVLQDVYLLPSQPLLSPWLSHLIGTLMLFLLQHFKSVYAPPVVYFQDQEYQCTRLNCLFVDSDPNAHGRKTDHEDEEVRYRSRDKGSQDAGMLDMQTMHNGARNGLRDRKERDQRSCSV
jgi:hypothetical protein